MKIQPAGETTQFRRKSCGISWPTATRAGWVILLAESEHPAFDIVGSPHTYHELYSNSHQSIESMAREARKLSRDHDDCEFFGDTTHPIHSIWIQQNGPDISPIRYADDPNDLFFYSHLIDKVRTSPRILFLDHDSGIEGKLIVGMSRDEIATGRAADYPLVAALGCVLSEFELNPFMAPAKELIPQQYHQSNGWML